MAEKAKILYVDDEKANLTSFKFLFKEYYDIQIADSADLGFKLMEQTNFDLVLSDQRMPKISGTEFLTRIRKVYPYPFRMIVTGFSDIDAVIAAINSGHIYYFFKKPWDENEIRIVIDRAMDSIRIETLNKKLTVDLKIEHEKLAEEVKLRALAQNDLSEANDDLELRIEERTRALNESKELAESSSRITQLTIENMGQGIFMVNAEGNVLVCNDVLLGYLNISKEQAKSIRKAEDLRTLASKSFLEENVDQSVKIARAGNTASFDIITLGGVVLEVNQNPIPGGGFVRTYTDVTERKKAEASLVEQSALLKLLRTTATDANSATNFQEAIDTCLATVCKYTNWPMGHAYFLSDDNENLLVSSGIWHLDDPKKFRAFVDISEKMTYKAGIGLPGRVLESGNPEWVKDVTGEANFPRAKVAEDLNVHGAFALPVLSRKKVVGVLEFFTEKPEELDESLLATAAHIGGQLGSVFDRVQIENTLRTERERLDSALRGGNLGFWEYHTDSNQFYLSNLYEEILGYKLPEGEKVFIAPLEKWGAMIHTDDARQATKSFYIARDENHREYHEEYRVKAADSTWKWLLTIGRVATDDKGDPTDRMLGIMIDITGMKQLQNALNVAKEEAEAASDAKASFLAAMSHEIRTPMNGVVGMVDLLAQTKMDAEQQIMLQTVKDSGQSLLTIINDILDFSKIEAGKLDLEAIDTQVTDLVETSAQSLGPNATSKNIQVVTFIDTKIPQYLQLDPVRVRQIITNLGSNAIKFSDKGEVLIRAELISSKKKQVIVRFSVVDQGIGISKEAQAGLFQEFNQADTSTTRKFGGTGLGLAISKRLTEMMDGSIGVNSELGQGSTFYCELPFAVPDVAARVGKELKVNDLSGLHILLVSPSKNYEDVCCHYLDHWNADVSTTTDIDSCLAIAQELVGTEKAIDIIVIPYLDDHNKVVAIREQFIEVGMMPYPRFVIGEDPRQKSEILQKLEEVTLININPLARAGFVNAVAIAAGRASPEVQPERQGFKINGGRAPTPKEALEQGKLILLAEDNLTNQDVIRRQLTRLGYACDIASDGKEAYEMWCKKSYAVLLTDCHMPEWDGFELTTAIRKDEESTGKRCPIIAITANALQGEAERCIKAGMDDYMSKPVEMKTLQATLHKWMGDGGTSDDKGVLDQDGKTQPFQSNDQVGESTGNEPINERALKDVFGEDLETFKEILTDFMEPSQATINDIHSGFENRSADEVGQASHKLKSAAFSVGAEELGELCKSLEAAAKEANWKVISDGVSKIDGLMKLVANYISQL
ncbi:MAG: hypothetical protein COB20_02725 [SAR86 cluster bacterium]|uniref:Sensory/regulatory protein RpfC n=1 Tax=SAR86 cluster bacterium TaxID=2030880 RepID=A0A2A4XFE9_9GAMM|nr:MAG: hypothetical protein COB20_02725 [SAR86 cluster bacterium]